MHVNGFSYSLVLLVMAMLKIVELFSNNRMVFVLTMASNFYLFGSVMGSHKCDGTLWTPIE
jgi:hypothetical protein